MTEWINWSGSLKFLPAESAEPEGEEQLCDVVRRTWRQGRKLRVVGAGHSSSPLVKTDQVLLSLHKWKGILQHDTSAKLVTFKTGITIHDANEGLQQIDLALFNTGDVDVQTLAGAISTGTHGTGRKLQNLSSMLEGVSLVTPDGTLKTLSKSEHPDLMRALSVSLGSLGVLSTITVKVLPLFKLRRLELCTQIERCLENFDQLSDENRNVDFYWYPRSDQAKIRILNEPGNGTSRFSFVFQCMRDETDWVGKILPRHRELRFDEMEYALPREAGIECFREVRERIKAKHRKLVAWRVLYRNIAADQNYISPHYNRDSVSISLHHNAGLPFDQFFNDIEPIFIAYEGRPHWGKKHNLKAAQLKKLYPEWNAFHSIRKTFDPDGFFMNPYLDELFNDER